MNKSYIDLTQHSFALEQENQRIKEDNETLEEKRKNLAIYNIELISELREERLETQRLREENECLNHNLKAKQEFLDNQYNNYIKIVEEKDKRVNTLEAELRGYRLDETFSIGALKKKKKKLEKH